MKRFFLDFIQILIIVISICLQHMISFNNIELYLFGLLIIVLYYYTKEYKYSKSTIFFSLLFTLFNIRYNNINTLRVLTMIISFFGFFFLTEKLLIFLTNIFENIHIQGKNKKVSSFKFILVSTVIGLLCFMPYFLRFFPAHQFLLRCLAAHLLLHHTQHFRISHPVLLLL